MHVTKFDEVKRFDQLVGHVSAKHELQAAVTMPLDFPSVFGLRSDSATSLSTTVLVYGVGDNGKSALVDALARELALQPRNGTVYTVLNFDLSSAVQAEQGGTSKLVSLVFAEARRNQPTLLILDKLETLSADRTRHRAPSQGAKQGLTELLVQIQGVGNDNEGVVIVGITHTPYNIDSAILRRFKHLVSVEPPTAEELTQRIESFVREKFSSEQGTNDTVAGIGRAMFQKGFKFGNAPQRPTSFP